jgi:ribosome-binding factor A
MSRRIERVNELLRQEISLLLARQIKDPRLQGVISITRVNTSSDFRAAEVFLSVMGDPEAKLSAIKAIRSASSFLRRELRPRLTLRHTPFLTFSLDESLEEAGHLLEIMNSIREQGPAQDSIEVDDWSGGPLPSSSRSC